MAESNCTVPTNEELGQLSKLISSEHMIEIAVNNLELDENEVKSIEKDSEWKRNYKILKIWRNNADPALARRVGI